MRETNGVPPGISKILRRFPARRLHGFCILAAMAILTSSGCMTWKESRVEPRILILHYEPDAIRVRPAERTRIVLNDPVISGDSLVGEATDFREIPLRVAIPVDQIASVEERKLSVFRTAFLVSGITVVLGILDVVYMLTGSTGY